MTVEFHQSDDAQISLMEMRFFVPNAGDGDDPVKVLFHLIFSRIIKV